MDEKNLEQLYNALVKAFDNARKDLEQKIIAQAASSLSRREGDEHCLALLKNEYLRKYGPTTLKGRSLYSGLVTVEIKEKESNES